MTNREIVYTVLRERANEWVNGNDLVAAGAGYRFGARIHELRQAGHELRNGHRRYRPSTTIASSSRTWHRARSRYRWCPHDPEALTDKERRILVAYLDCERIEDTAEHLGLAQQTVKNHLHNIYAKLDTTNAIGAFKAMGWAKVPQ